MNRQDSPQDLPLKGVRVVDYSHFLAGPFMGRCMAALGAEVIKVERPKAGDAGRAHPEFKDGQSGYFLQHNMGKQGLCVDLRDKRGLDLMLKLADTADVFIENYRPGALDRLGLGYKALSARNPKLIYCSVSAYGHTGPYADRPGFGLIAEAMSGAMAQVGAPGETPPLLRMPLADMYAGIHGVAAINAALFGRAASGRGQHIDLALYDCMVSMHDFAVQRYFLSGGVDLPQTDRQRPAGFYRVRRLPGERRQSGDRRSGGRRVESSRETDRWRSAGGGRTVHQAGGPQRALCRGDGDRARLDAGAALAQRVP